MANIKVSIDSPTEWWRMVDVGTEEYMPDLAKENPEAFSILRYELPADLLERYVNAKEELFEVMNLVEKMKKEQDNE